MEPYNIVYAKIIKKHIKSIIPDQLIKIKEKIEITAEDPFKRSDKVKNPNLPERKIRIGNFRVLFDIDEDNRNLIIKAIKPRGEVYE